MPDFLFYFIDSAYIYIANNISNYTGVPVPGLSEPVIYLAYVITYIFLVVVLIRLVIAVVRWFYRI